MWGQGKSYWFWSHGRDLLEAVWVDRLRESLKEGSAFPEMGVSNGKEHWHMLQQNYKLNEAIPTYLLENQIYSDCAIIKMLYLSDDKKLDTFYDFLAIW